MSEWQIVAVLFGGAALFAVPVAVILWSWSWLDDDE